uniref:LRRNT domain-containing protein n=1 Tax=Macrostomum lignano TaxID=282301 RepID=A0A1I8IE34_9PLAT
IACVGPNSSLAWTGGLTRLALHRLIRLAAHGRVDSLASLYSRMDNATLRPPVRFSLLLGHRWLVKSADADKPLPRSSAISSLDLSGNRLTRVPAGPAGLLDRLSSLNLSSNRIVSLYSSDTCEAGWPHLCYWFRAAWLSLRVLDLSNNRVEAIGALQPWHQVSLNVLHLQNNRISRLDPLALGSRQLTASLMSLDLDDNLLTASSTSCSSLTQLRSLSLQRNLLEELNCSLLLPQTELLSKVLLSGNNISQLEHGCLLNLTGLQLIDLSDNQLRHFDYRTTHAGLRLSARLRPGARRGGARGDDGTGGFAYPDWLNRRNSSCLFYEEDSEGRSTRLGHISDARHEDFLCLLGMQRQPLPDRFCPTVRNCTARCLHGCACYRSRGWSRASLLCRSSETADPAASQPVDLPAVRVDLSGLPAGRLRRVSKQSLRWSSAGLSAPLTELMLNSSGVEVVEPDALDFNQ